MLYVSCSWYFVELNILHNLFFNKWSWHEKIFFSFPQLNFLRTHTFLPLLLLLLPLFKSLPYFFFFHSQKCIAQQDSASRISYSASELILLSARASLASAESWIKSRAASGRLGLTKAAIGIRCGKILSRLRCGGSVLGQSARCGCFGSAHVHTGTREVGPLVHPSSVLLPVFFSNNTANMCSRKVNHRAKECKDSF